MSANYVHGGTDEREIARLEKQARWTAQFSLPRFDAHPGQRVLDLACGVGAMAEQVARRFPGIELVGLDLSASQLRASRKNHPALPVTRADGGRMPFADATFDRVHCSWMLEHVPSPEAIVREVRRVLRPQGLCHFLEVDNWSFMTRPLLRDVHALLRRLNAAQVKAGGDPAIGQRLHRIFAGAGFRRFTLEPVVLHGSHADVGFLQSFVDEFAEIFEGLDESLGADAQPLIERATAELRSLMSNPAGSLHYRAWVAHGLR